jgi:hypothetical protein
MVMSLTRPVTLLPGIFLLLLGFQTPALIALMFAYWFLWLAMGWWCPPGPSDGHHGRRTPPWSVAGFAAAHRRVPVHRGRGAHQPVFSRRRHWI